MRLSRRWTAIAAVATMLTGRAEAGRALDCPLRDAPFSTKSPLIDLLANARARAMVEDVMPGVLAALPPDRFSTTAPTFAAIVTLRDLGNLLGRPLTDPDRLDDRLRTITLTAADRTARCARYDDDHPAISFPSDGRLRVLLFEKITGFRDAPSVEAAHSALADMASRNDWALVATDKGGVMRRDLLADVDVIIWNNVSGDVLTVPQRAAFREYIERGGGFVGLHGAGGDPSYFWDWYADTLIGARFTGHSFGKNQFQRARIVLEPRANGLGEGIPTEWHMTDEWYSFDRNPRRSGSRVVATLDESSYVPEGMWKKDLRMGDHPIAWTRLVGRGRSFYSAIGHLPETYTQPEYNRLIGQAIVWAARHRQ